MKLYSYSDELFSDLYESVRNRRPTSDTCDHWNSLSPDDKQSFWNKLYDELVCELAIERELEQNSIDEIEAEIKLLIKLGAKNREAAIRFMMQSHETDDLEHFCYLRNLPLKYFAA